MLARMYEKRLRGYRAIGYALAGAEGTRDVDDFVAAEGPLFQQSSTELKSSAASA